MALSDALKGGRAARMTGKSDGGDMPPVAVSIKAEPLDAKHAAGLLLKAIDAKDVEGIDDALRLHYAACEQEEDDKDEDEDDDHDDDEGDEYGG
jgi:hypothetical protein